MRSDVENLHRFFTIRSQFLAGLAAIVGFHSGTKSQVLLAVLAVQATPFRPVVALLAGFSPSPLRQRRRTG